MLRINQLKIKSEEVHRAKVQGLEGLQGLLRRKAAGILRISEKEVGRLDICRESMDARKKPEIYYIYTVELYPEQQEKIWKRLQKSGGKGTGAGGSCKNAAGSLSVAMAGGVQITAEEPVRYHFPECGKAVLQYPIVIVGTGPAGLFCAYFLTLHGYRVILLERGKRVEDRQADVEEFWRTGRLNLSSNVQFGEGGAGTFSDGKLNTLVKDKEGRSRAVLQVFVDCGAREEILYEAKPHIGTDVLCLVVRRMREKILEQGGEVRFESQMTDVEIREGKICGVEINHEERLSCEQLVLATGHSARDTFEMLYKKEIPMEAKSFAVGLRVEHPQTLIDRSQYGGERGSRYGEGGGCEEDYRKAATAMEGLGAAAYKVTAQADNGRGVYSFCMCPGGYVVNASSEEGRLVVNGMSYSGRNGRNANSAIIVAVTPEDYGADHPLAGVEFQRRLEERAFALAGGKIPMQRYEVFRTCVESGRAQAELDRTVDVDTGMFLEDNAEDRLSPEHKGASAWADVSGILPGACNEAFVQGMEHFGRQIKGFDRGDTILSGVESRTSSPLRICRDDTMQSRVRGLYPCGEGAGYAGGITSAAMDGLRVAEQIARVYAPMNIQFCNRIMSGEWRQT